ncbi:hypothetical protein [Streptomyces sp. CMB-StM0423]|uniref:hypothetical protein n=1 Tax=Streptomyces sp. CMB-StM0423 TaxID=2059884 RepID=UPI000C7075C2|nr:hypothetical protein [Streptomyces sp. CMB-StM0423]AUH42716.1 hypothetical protein CXR04_23300 [Streptomyces sp. CMB-StM0423]
MPRGRYSLYDPYDGTPLGDEHFQCAPGASGWRYTARTTDPDGTATGSVDLTIDHLGRPVRLELHAAGWQVRGAALDGITWVRSDATGDQAREGNARAHGFTGTSPAFLIATTRLLGPPSTQAPQRLRLVALTHPVLAPRTLDQAWKKTGEDTHEADTGPLQVVNYQVSDLETGKQGEVHIAGDVVLAAPGVELEELDTPPNSLDA